ncbi:gas vesicle protein [Nonomuraea sp. K274]|uniref:Gas vesicle protein n=1 Tax=Nonomuraea cypriaca TaxID=1187855 RepID=A0A931EYP2_9ACTN|nr:gas vesicle protein GvpO [Nonomuraea cypriaca]MBF8185421.1 gas vesicle protein [Nonomuraea cypriaca]
MAARRPAAERRGPEPVERRGRESVERSRPEPVERSGPEPVERRARELSAATAGEAGLRHIADLTARDIEGVTAVQPTEEGWVVGVEAVEDRRIPSSGDLLALYEVELDTEGSLLSYRRIRRYRRANADQGEAY